MSKERELLDALKLRMIEFYHGDPARIHHFLKVSSFTAAIARGEQADAHTQFILEALGLIHDIGIRIGEERFGTCTWKQQEELGPPAARQMLTALGFDEADIDRICLIIAHHHTYDAAIEGLDFRIMLEADACVNMYERANVTDEARRGVLKTVFRTETGIHIYRTMFDLED